jgi:hypothetical protein
MKSVNKKIVFVILLIANSWFQCIGQDSVELRIKEIKSECEKINKEIKKFKMVQSDVNDLSAEGGILKKYVDGNTLKRAALTLFGEAGQSTTEYYFLNGNLVFVNEQVEIYKTPLGMGKVETKSLETNKFYFDKQKLIRWIVNDDEIVDRLLYSEKEKEFLDDLKNIIIKNK